MTIFGKTPHITFLIVLIIFNSQLFSQTHSFRHFTTEDGLPSSEVHDVVQDDNGYMWFATDRGLVRFDGYDFEVHTTKDGLPDNVLIHLKKSSDGTLWFVGLSGSMGLIKNGQIHSYRHNTVIQETLETPLVLSFNIDSNQNVHLGTQKSGYLQIDKHGNHTLDTSNYRHNIKIVDNASIFYRHGNMMQKSSYQLKYENDSTSLFSIPSYHSTISSSYFDRESNSTFFVLNNSVYRVLNNKCYLVLEAEKRILSIALIKGYLWISYLENGVDVFDLELNEYKLKELLYPYSITSVLEDDENGYWFSTLANGVYYLPSIKHRSYTELKEQRITSTYKLALHNQKIFIEGSNFETYVFSISNNHLKHVPISLNNGEHNIAYDFISSDTSLTMSMGMFHCRLDQNSTTLIHTPQVHLSAIKEKGIYYAIKAYKSAVQIGEYNITQKKFTPYQIDHIFKYQHQGYKLFKNKKGQLFIHSKNGIVYLKKINAKKYSYQRMPDVDSISNRNVVEMMNYLDYDFIACTKGNGILFRKNNKTFSLDDESGLISSISSSMAVDESNTIWLGTSQGLTKIDSNFRITNIRKEDGLISNEVTALAVDSNNVYVGTKKGLTVLDKNHIDKQEVLIPVLIKSIELKGVEKHVPENNQLSISYEEPYININFVGISYKSMGRIRYRYRLQQEDDWQYTSNTTLLFNNLGSGKYTLEIQATNGDNNWDSPITSLNIFVTYPFWRTTPFYVIAILSFLSLFYLFYKLSITRIKNKEAIKHQIQNLRFEALSAQMNPHFMFNSLNAIQNFIMQNEKKSSVRYLSKFAKLMRITLNHSQAKNITLAEELSALELYLQLEQLRFDHQFDFTIETSKNLETDKTIFPALLIQPIVENAILHGIRPAKQKGHILIKLRLGKSGLHVSVRDNGVGRNLDKTAKDVKKKDGHISKGSLMTQERVALFAKENKGNHSYEIIDHSENETPSGTEVKIILPNVYLLKVNAE